MDWTAWRGCQSRVNTTASLLSITAPKNPGMSVLKGINPIHSYSFRMGFPNPKHPIRSGSETWIFNNCNKPIPSMYGIFAYIFHKNQPNVGKYTIHGWYGKGPPSISKKTKLQDPTISLPYDRWALGLWGRKNARWPMAMRPFIRVIITWPYKWATGDIAPLLLVENHYAWTKQSLKHCIQTTHNCCQHMWEYHAWSWYLKIGLPLCCFFLYLVRSNATPLMETDHWNTQKGQVRPATKKLLKGEG